MSEHSTAQGSPAPIVEQAGGYRADDVLRGAAAIAGFLFGDRGMRRRVYHLVATSRLPHFRTGNTLCARKSVLTQWVQEQENRSR